MENRNDKVYINYEILTNRK